MQDLFYVAGQQSWRENMYLIKVVNTGLTET